MNKDAFKGTQGYPEAIREIAIQLRHISISIEMKMAQLSSITLKMNISEEFKQYALKICTERGKDCGVCVCVCVCVKGARD